MATRKRSTPKRNRLAKLAAPLRLPPVNERKSKFAATVVWIDAEVINGDELRGAMSAIAGMVFGRQEK